MILKLLKKPYVVFWSFVPLLLLLSFYQEDQTIDINIHDTYFVISQKQILGLLSGFFGFTGLIYKILDNFNFNTLVSLNALHLIFTVGIILASSIRRLLTNLFLGNSYYVNTYVPDSSIWICVIIIIAGQIAFIINIILSMLKGRNYKTKAQ